MWAAKLGQPVTLYVLTIGQPLSARNRSIGATLAFSPNPVLLVLSQYRFWSLTFWMMYPKSHSFQLGRPDLRRISATSTYRDRPARAATIFVFGYHVLCWELPVELPWQDLGRSQWNSAPPPRGTYSGDDRLRPLCQRAEPSPLPEIYVLHPDLSDIADKIDNAYALA